MASLMLTPFADDPGSPGNAPGRLLCPLYDSGLVFATDNGRRATGKHWLIYELTLHAFIIRQVYLERGGSLVAENASGLVVETYRLTKFYSHRQIALNDVTLSIEPGWVLGLLGPNGAGKTTFLRLILGLHRPSAGWVKVFGKAMHANAADLRRRIGYIPTNPMFPSGMTPITYLDYVARLFGLPADVRKPRLASLIRAVDLLPVSGEPIAGFSNGMTSRLAVAASLINEPELLIWDEPTHGL